MARALHSHQSLPDPSSPPLLLLTPNPEPLSLPTLSGRCLGDRPGEGSLKQNSPPPKAPCCR
eukprot:scaffold17922_cov115-Isochrysis_galbana.AAC.2